MKRAVFNYKNGKVNYDWTIPGIKIIDDPVDGLKIIGGKLDQISTDLSSQAQTENNK